MFGRSEYKYQDKLFHALVKNSNTVYLMYDMVKSDIIYTTRNIEEVLGIKDVDYKKGVTKIVAEVLNIPIIKEELKNWDEKSEFVSGMVAYHNTSYQYTRWIRVKIYPFKDKKKSFQVILISDVTAEHDRQHLLVTQAADVKLREQQLNQIEASIYDVEMTIQIGTGVLRLKNLKDISHYFGDNCTGNTKLELKRIVENYVLKEDQKAVLDDINKIASMKDDLVNGTYSGPTSIKYRYNCNEEKWLESKIFYNKGKSGSYITILTKDVTEDAEYVKKQNEILQQALNDSKAANDAVSEFLAIMSHEIRSQVNVINGLSESSLSSDDLTKEVKEDMENINTASDSLIDVIDGILNISMLGTGAVELKEKEYDLAKFIKDLEIITKKNLKEKDVNVEVAVDPNMPSVLYGDSSKLKQVLLNILNNSSKYTLKGNITIKVKWNGSNDIGKLTISVSDTGVGIDKKKLESLMSNNVKADNKTYISGMGLYIARKYVNLLNGELTAESEINHGSTFTVTINQKVISDTPIGDIYAHQSKKKNINTFIANDKRILIVDDDALNIKVATRLLKPYEVNIESVKSGKECIELLQNDKNFDLILLDQMMPEMSGTETLRKLKDENINIKTVMLTADAMVGKKELYLKAGFDDYLSKPINTEELNRVLERFLK